MSHLIKRILILATLLLPTAVTAEPVTLKLSFFSSDRSTIYRSMIKPFVDAINAEAADHVQIKVYFHGAIDPAPAKQPQLVSDGVADIAIAVPGYLPEQFADSTVLELPGLFHDEIDASLAFTRLTAANVLEGFDDYHIIGAFVSQGESIHSRQPIPDLKALKGQTIRVNNPIQAEVLRRFGAKPELVPVNRISSALSQHKIDGATVPLTMLFQFGIGSIATHHYMLRVGGVPTVMIMNRKKLESLPPQAQAVIRKYSGEWLVRRAAAETAADNEAVLKKLEADDRRAVVLPSRADLAASRAVFETVIEEWAKQSPRRRSLLARVREELAQLHNAK